MSHLRTATCLYHKSLLAAKKLYHSNLIKEHREQPRLLWKTINSILHRKSPKSVPSAGTTGMSIAQSFASFFADKITKLHASIPPSTAPLAAQIPPSVPLPLTAFRAVTNDEICRLIQSAPDKQCEIDPIPTSLLKNASISWLLQSRTLSVCLWILAIFHLLLSSQSLAYSSNKKAIS